MRTRTLTPTASGDREEVAAGGRVVGYGVHVLQGAPSNGRAVIPQMLPEGSVADEDWEDHIIFRVG